MSTERLAARGTDPLTSWESAEKIERSGKAADQRAIAVEAVNINPGCTSFELSRLCSLERHQIARRLSECKSLRKGEPRRCMVTGNMAVTWWPVEMA